MQQMRAFSLPLQHIVVSESRLWSCSRARREAKWEPRLESGPFVQLPMYKVALEVMSYHARASEADCERIKAKHVPTCTELRLDHLMLNTYVFDDDGSILACIRMFLDFGESIFVAICLISGFVQQFSVPYDVLCRWLLTVKKNYRHGLYLYLV